MGICYGANFRYGKEACKGADLCVDNTSNVGGFDKAFSLISDTGGSHGGSSAQGNYGFDDTLDIHVGDSLDLDQAKQGVDCRFIQPNNNIEKRLGTASRYRELGHALNRDETLSQDVVSESNDDNVDTVKKSDNCIQPSPFIYGHAPAEWYGLSKKAAVRNHASNNVAQALDKIISGIAWAFSKDNICDNENLYDVPMVLDSRYVSSIMVKCAIQRPIRDTLQRGSRNYKLFRRQRLS